MYNIEYILKLVDKAALDGINVDVNVKYIVNGKKCEYKQKVTSTDYDNMELRVIRKKNPEVHSFLLQYS